MDVAPRSDKRYWWEANSGERFWCEVTDRTDVGADLHCPQANEVGNEQLGYSLIRLIWPGDVIFHYSTRARAIIGASVAGGPLEERPIVWTPHGTVGKSKKHPRDPRPGWWLPVYTFTRTEKRLTLRDLQAPKEDQWIRGWIQAKGQEVGGPIAAPFQRYKNKLRAAQTYLAKMPLDFVKRWTTLRELSDAVDATQEMLSPLGDYFGVLGKHSPGPSFKNDAEYVAFVRGGTQRRSRSHETLVRAVAEHISNHGGKVSTPHPIDLHLDAPRDVILEAKTTKTCTPLSAVREAIGQLLEYKYFLHRNGSALCILLDQNPGPALTKYVEQGLGVYIAWWAEPNLVGGEQTFRDLAAIGVVGSTD